VPDGTETQSMCPPHVVSPCIPVDYFSIPKLAIHREYRTTPSGVLLHSVFILACCHAPVSLSAVQGVLRGILGTSSFSIITLVMLSLDLISHYIGHWKGFRQGRYSAARKLVILFPGWGSHPN
jgi:hypothetical protein